MEQKKTNKTKIRQRIEEQSKWKRERGERVRDIQIRLELRKQGEVRKEKKSTEKHTRLRPRSK